MSELSDILRRWRRVRMKNQRLYWRRKHPGWQRFDNDDICLIKTGVGSHHFKTWEALVYYIESLEFSAKRRGEKNE